MALLEFRTDTGFTQAPDLKFPWGNMFDTLGALGTHRLLINGRAVLAITAAVIAVLGLVTGLSGTLSETVRINLVKYFGMKNHREPVKPRLRIITPNLTEVVHNHIGDFGHGKVARNNIKIGRVDGVSGVFNAGLLFDQTLNFRAFDTLSPLLVIDLARQRILPGGFGKGFGSGSDPTLEAGALVCVGHLRKNTGRSGHFIILDRRAPSIIEGRRAPPSLKNRVAQTCSSRLRTFFFMSAPLPNQAESSLCDIDFARAV